MRRAHFISRLLLAALPLAPLLAAAAGPDVSRLGKDLTPVGAERPGNPDGTLPAWDGGLTQPPAGWTRPQGCVDP
jgi:hypothetical protein